jgi:hypothetical protein
LQCDKWEISEEQKRRALEALREYEYCFALKDEPLGILKDYVHHIDVGDSKPVSSRPRPLPEARQKILDQILQDMLERGIIRHSNSEWAAPVCLVLKPGKPPNSDNPRHWRLTVDYSKTNKVIRQDSFPLPNMLQLLTNMKHSKLFSILDLASSFFQILLSPGLGRGMSSL